MAKKQIKERSPSFPFIPLEETIKRLKAFDQTFGRHPAPADKAGLAWGMKEKSSQAYQTLAALKSFGLVEYQGSSRDRSATLSEQARTYLRAQQDTIWQAVLKDAALKPTQIKKFWDIWGADRPPDPVCLDDLILKHAFTDSAAHNFLRVFDATIAYAGLSDSDTLVEPSDDVADEAPNPSEVAVGDLVQIEIGGSLQLQQPKRVRAIQEYQGADWVFIEGEETGFPMEQVVLESKAQDVAGSPDLDRQPPRLPISPPSDESMREDKASLDEGVVVLRWPSNLSKDSVEDFEYWIKGVIRRARRRAGLEEASDVSRPPSAS